MNPTTEILQPLIARGRLLLDEAEALTRDFHAAPTGKDKARALIALETWMEQRNMADWEAMAAADGEPGRR